MPTGITNTIFHKHCAKCNKEFFTHSNIAKYCIECKESSKLVICCNCGSQFKRDKKGRVKQYCLECREIKVYCKCGCGNILPFKRAINGGLFIHGHARRGRKNSAYHNLMISQKNTGKKHTAESRKNMSLGQIGKKQSEETKQKRSQMAKEKGYGLWMIGRKLSPETCKKLSERNLPPCKEETKIKIGAANSGVNNGMYGQHHTKEVRESISQSVSELIVNGSRKRSKYQTGVFYSQKNNKDLWYRSSYELMAFTILEGLSAVKFYHTEPFRIPYDKNGQICNYVPDILVEYIDGKKELIEIKPKIFLNDETNLLKFDAAQQYCKENNYVFSVWTEDHLELVQ
jgi:hypothetical protein